MITWTDTGILLTARPHGEHAMIIDVMTPSHGRVAGVVRGGRSRKMAPHLQAGAQLHVTWSARIEAHLGSFTVEPQRARAGIAMADRKALAGLQAVTALAAQVLPERQAFPALYAKTEQMLDLVLVTEVWPLAYLRWERDLLQALGYGMDLSTCAVTGVSTGLVYVSPKTGRAVSAKGAGDWADRLLPLPACLLPDQEGPDPEIAQAMETTGYFLRQAMGGDRDLPEARRRLRDLLSRA